VRPAVQPGCRGQKIIDEMAKHIGPGWLLVAPAIQAPAAQRCGRVDLDHGARSGTIHWAPGGIKLRQQDRAAQGDVCDPVRRDAQRHQAQLVLDEGVRAAMMSSRRQSAPPLSWGMPTWPIWWAVTKPTNAPGQPNGQSIPVLQACWMASRMTSSPAG